MMYSETSPIETMMISFSESILPEEGPFESHIPPRSQIAHRIDPLSLSIIQSFTQPPIDFSHSTTLLARFTSSSAFCAIVAAICFYRSHARFPRIAPFPLHRRKSSLIKGRVAGPQRKKGWKSLSQDLKNPAAESLKNGIIESQFIEFLQGRLSLREFFQDNGHDALRSLSSETLGKYHYPFLEYLIRQKLGVDEARSVYREALFGLGITEEELIHATLRPCLKDFLNSSSSYLLFRSKNHPSSYCLLAGLEQLALRNDPRPKRELLQLPYEQIAGSAFSFDREVFGVSQEEILFQIMFDLETLPYLGKSGFREKHGLRPLEKGLVPHSSRQIAKRRLLSDLQEIAYRDFQLCQADCRLLGISQKEKRDLFTPDMHTLSFLEIIRKHGPDIFFDEDIMQNSEQNIWKQKVQEMFLALESIEQIAAPEYIAGLPKKEILEQISSYSALLEKYIRENSWRIFIQNKGGPLPLFEQRGIMPLNLQMRIDKTRASAQSQEKRFEEELWKAFVSYQKKMDLLEGEQQRRIDHIQDGSNIRDQKENIKSLEKAIRECLKQMEELHEIEDNFDLDETDLWLAIEKEEERIHATLIHLQELHAAKKSHLSFALAKQQLELEILELAFSERRRAVEIEWIQRSEEIEERRRDHSSQALKEWRD